MKQQLVHVAYKDLMHQTRSFSRRCNGNTTKNAPMVKQDDHIDQVLDGRDDQCLELQLGRLLVALGPLWQALA